MLSYGMSNDSLSHSPIYIYLLQRNIEIIKDFFSNNNYKVLLKWKLKNSNNFLFTSDICIS